MLRIVVIVAVVIAGVHILLDLLNDVCQFVMLVGLFVGVDEINH